jgi:hypothetical protein
MAKSRLTKTAEAIGGTIGAAERTARDAGKAAMEISELAKETSKDLQKKAKALSKDVKRTQKKLQKLLAKIRG